MSVAFISSSEVFVQSPDEQYLSFPLSSTGKNMDESFGGLFCSLRVLATVPSDSCSFVFLKMTVKSFGYCLQSTYFTYVCMTPYKEGFLGRCMFNALFIEYIPLGSYVRSSAKGSISQLETLSSAAVPTHLVPQAMSGEKTLRL